MSFEILWNEIRPMYHTKRARESQTEKEESREKKKLEKWTAASYRFNGMKCKKKWQYSNFLSDSLSGPLSFLNEPYILAPVLVCRLCFAFASFSHHLLHLHIFRGNIALHQVLLRIMKRNVFTTTLSMELQFCGISLLHCCEAIRSTRSTRLH